MIRNLTAIALPALMLTLGNCLLNYLRYRPAKTGGVEESRAVIWLTAIILLAGGGIVAGLTMAFGGDYLIHLASYLIGRDSQYRTYCEIAAFCASAVIGIIWAVVSWFLCEITADIGKFHSVNPVDADPVIDDASVPMAQVETAADEVMMLPHDGYERRQMRFSCIDPVDELMSSIRVAKIYSSSPNGDRHLSARELASIIKMTGWKFQRTDKPWTLYFQQPDRPVDPDNPCASCDHALPQTITAADLALAIKATGAQFHREPASVPQA